MSENRRGRVLGVGAFFVVLVALCSLVFFRGEAHLSEESVTSSTAQSGEVTTSTSLDANSAASAVPNAVVPSLEPKVDSKAVEAIDTKGSASVVVVLDVDPSGSDAEKAAQVRTALDALLETLPPGSYSHESRELTVATIPMTVDRFGLDALEKSKDVTVVKQSREFSPTAVSDLAPSLQSFSPTSTNATTAQGANLAWANAKKGGGATVAIVDSGVAVGHTFLSTAPASIWEGCFATAFSLYTSPCPNGTSMGVSQPPIPGSAAPCPVAQIPRCAHGTHVAGIAVGGSGATAVSGIAPEASLVAVNVFSYNGALQRLSAEEGDIINALQWLYNKRATFSGLSSVNLSLGDGTLNTGYCDSDPLKGFIDQLAQVGIATVIAAGNEGRSNGVSSPGCISTAITVGAVDDTTGQSTSFSNDGPQVDIMAAGQSICSSVPSGTTGSLNCTGPTSGPFASLSGTSMAAPAVAGAIAVLAGDGVPSSQWLIRLQKVAQASVCVQASGYVIPTLRLDVALGITPSTTYGCGGSPFGVWDNSTAGAGTITVRGWAIDLGQLETVPLHVYVDGAFAQSGLAAELRSDVGAVYPFYGSNRGFSIPVTVNGGTRNVCVAMINQGPGSNVWLGCRSVVVPGGSPFGAVDVVMGRVGGVDVAGWAIDPDTALPAQAHVYAFRGDGSVAGATAVTAGNFRSDLGVVFPGYGPNHGMSGSLSLPGGTYSVCVAAINVAGSGSNQWLPCRSAVVP